MKTHILCAMRDSSTLTHMLRMLEDEQECTCRVVRSGEAALLSAKKRRPDVLVIDAVLPLMDGLGVIDRLKEFYGERMPRVMASPPFSAKMPRAVRSRRSSTARVSATGEP